MKDLSLFPDENAKKQEERSALSSSPLQAKFKKTRRKSALTTISAEDEMRRVNGMWELKKVMSDKPIAGRSIHILTGGNIDLLSHLIWLLQFWPKVRRVFLSAWAISAVDIDIDQKLKKFDTYYIVAANDVGQAKERIAMLLDIMKAEQEKEQGIKVENNRRTTIRKAMPFEVDCIVPKEFSDLFYEKATE